MLGQHHAHQHMWPDHFAERQAEIGTGAQFGRDTVRAADHQCHIGASGVTPSGQPFREIGRGHQRTAFVQCADQRARGNHPLQQGSLCRHAAALLVLDLVHLHGAKAQRTPAPVEPRQVIVDQCALGAGPQPANRADMNPHQADVAAVVCVAPAGSHIFSSW